MSILQKIADFTAYRRTVRELNGLDSRQLSDIGITRFDIPSVARGRTR
jgi:uncharacterized protein YjiS (DUF1127 family)